jgi:hypothetical protein
MEKIFQIWLDHQCRILSGSRHAMLLTGPPDKGPYDQILFWPDHRHDQTMLSRVAHAALRDKKTAIKSLSDKGEKTGEPLDILACPLFLADELLGVVAIERIHQSLSKQREAIEQIQTGARWLEAMMALPLDPALGSKKNGHLPLAKSAFGPVPSRATKLLGPNRLPLKLGVGLVAVLLVGLFLMNTLWRTPSDTGTETVNRHTVVPPQQRYAIKTQPPSGDTSADEKVAVTLDEQALPVESPTPQRQVGQLSQTNNQTPTRAEITKTAPTAVLSEEKPSSLSAADTRAQKSSVQKDLRVQKAETETTPAKPVDALYSIKIGPIIEKQELQEAMDILQGQGIDFQQVVGKGPVKVTRLLEGLYPPDKAHKRFNAIRKVVDSAFILAEKGKLAIYVATYHDRVKANQKIQQLAKKNIKVTAVATELKMKGSILVVQDVGGSTIETITDQMSKMGLSANVLKSG